MADTAVFDVDGTLIDSNYHQAVAWFRALRRYGVTAAVWRIHRSIGMGSGKLVVAVAGEQFEDEHGDDVRAAQAEEMKPLWPEVVPFEGAQELLSDVYDRGFTVVLASSGGSDQTEHYVDLLDGRRYATTWTTSADVQEAKPAPDLLQAAIDKVDGRSAVMIGDSPYDAQAAAKIDVPTIAVRTGGFSVDELIEAGASTTYESLVDLRNDLDNTALARPS